MAAESERQAGWQDTFLIQRARAIINYVFTHMLRWRHQPNSKCVLRGVPVRNHIINNVDAISHFRTSEFYNKVQLEDCKSFCNFLQSEKTGKQHIKQD